MQMPFGGLGLVKSVHSVVCRQHLIGLVPFRLSGWHLNANVCMDFKKSECSFSLHDFLFHKAYAFF